MGRNDGKSLAKLPRSLLFYLTLVVVAIDIAVLNGELLIPWLYSSSACHLLDETGSHFL